jgi:hypothetical protein
MVVPPIMAGVPMSSNPLWLPVSQAVRVFGEVVGPSSPLALYITVAIRGIRGTGGAAGLSWLVTEMAAYQSALAASAFAMAVLALKRQEPRLTGVDPRLAFRPVCGDDPVFWREFDLPNRTGSPPKLLISARQFVGLLRLLLTVVLQLVGIAIIFAIPLALLVVTARLGLPAYVEAWHGGSFAARREFGQMVRGVSVFVAMVGLLGVTATAAGRVTSERDKATWVPLLTTPLEGSEILGGKMWATATGHWKLARVLVPLWLLGVFCGALDPIGTILVALDLAAAFWFGVALGTWLGVRPGATSTSTSTAALCALGLVVLHAPYVYIGLEARPDVFAAYRTGGPVLVGIVVALVVCPFATAAAARWLTRRTFARFDAYVDRPRRVARP